MPAGYAVARRSIPASCRWWFCVAGACCAAAGASAAEFRELLADAGVNAAQFASLDDLPLEPTAPQRQIIDAILFRLDQLERGQLPGIADIAPWQSLPPESAAVTPGSLVHLSGIALHVEQISAAEDEALPLLRCTVRLETGAEPVQVVCRRAPRRWPRGEPIEEPVELTGVMTGATAAG
ncbi:MAG TPA: hypothetical protein PKC18_14500, partial [Lacipirellulaceae bacterium]|nr:hypothetical protein [Lacipirellulaceae bacterium]